MPMSRGIQDSSHSRGKSMPYRAESGMSEDLKFWKGGGGGVTVLPNGGKVVV